MSSKSFKSLPYCDTDAVAQDSLILLEGRSTYSPEIRQIACAELWMRKFIEASCETAPVS